MIMGSLAIIILVTAVLTTDCLPVQKGDEWEQWKAKFGKRYTTRADEAMRRQIFYANKAAIDEHNQNPGSGFTMQLNDMSDLTYDEFKATYLGSDTPTERLAETRLSNRTLRDFPDTLDWYKKGAVTVVEHQGTCGSCWAFSAAAALESRRFLKTGDLRILSKQNLMDCSYQYGNNACHGGWVPQAFRYVKDAGGINSFEDYRYTGKDSTVCKFVNATSKKYAALTPEIFITSPSGELALIEALQSGPVSISFNVLESFKNLGPLGIYSAPDCGTTGTNHAMLLVGYGTDSATGQKFWLVKNSWGFFWGDWGYGRIIRGVNMCAIENVAYTPILE